MTDISRNAELLVLFANSRDSGVIRTLGSQMFATQPTFLPSAYADATSKPYGYLLIDSRAKVPNKYRVKTGIFEDEQAYLYLPE